MRRRAIARFQAASRPSASPDSGAGQDGGSDAGQDGSPPPQPDSGPPPPSPDAGTPPPPPPSDQDERMLDQLENAPTVQEEDAKRRAANHRHVRGMEDK